MVPVAVIAWAVALLVSYVPWSAGPVIGVSVLGMVLVPFVHRWRRSGAAPRAVVVGSAPLTAVCLAVAGATGLAAAWGTPAREQAAVLAGHAATAEVSVRSLPSLGADGRLWADADTIRLGSGESPGALSVPVRIGVPPGPRTGTLGPGTVLRFSAQVKGADAGERAAVVLFARGAVVQVSRGGAIERIAGDVRAAFISRTRSLPEPGSELLPGLAVGDVRAVSDDLDAAMKASGLSHLTAVSGSNLALVAAAAFGVVALCGGGRRLRVLVAVIALAGFVVLVTPQPSVVRAAAMAGVALSALLLGRPRAGLSVLLLAVTVLLLADPHLAAAPGFALSAAATAGLVVLAPPLTVGLAVGAAARRARRRRAALGPVGVRADHRALRPAAVPDLGRR